MPAAACRGRLRRQSRRVGIPAPKTRQETRQKGRGVMRKLSTLWVALAAGLSIAAIAPQAQAAGTVKIGVLFPLTGNAGAAGQASKAAVEVAAEIINGKHPELGTI